MIITIVMLMILMVALGDDEDANPDYEHGDGWR